MALITWNDSLSIGVAEIDRQHQKIIGMINGLDNALRAGREADIISEIIDGLIIYTATHFRIEEGYFSKFSYSDAAQHKEEHAAFIAKVRDLTTEFTRGSGTGQAALGRKIMSFLSEWWRAHILETDMKYVRLFNENGLK